MKTLRTGVAVVLTAAAAILLPGAARAARHPEPPQLRLELPARAELGSELTATAQLTDATGRPVAGAPVRFLTVAAWGEMEDGASEVELGVAKTGADGLARFTFQVRRSETIAVVARFDGDERMAPARAQATVAVAGDFQLYRLERPAVSAVVPRIAPWILGGVLATVWSLYFLTARLVLRIARDGALAPAAPGERDAVASTRRRFLGNLVPVGMQAVIAPIGLGLTAIIVRSPYTHANVAQHQQAPRVRRTPYAHVTDQETMTTLPPVLSREVSFSREVLPILLANAGPHVVPPKNSPPPRGVRLDSYAQIMAKEGLVRPGKPEASELVGVLIDPAMRMPPSIQPLPTEQIQVIASWIAQGAKEN